MTKYRTSLLLATFICLAGVALASCTPQASNGSVPPSVPAGVPPVAVPATMYATDKAQVANSLHLTVAQITSQLQSDPQADLMGIGKSQGLAQDQLQRLLVAALQSASDQNVRDGIWTQQQADADTAYWNGRSAAELISDITDWFRTH